MSFARCERLPRRTRPSLSAVQFKAASKTDVHDVEVSELDTTTSSTAARLNDANVDEELEARDTVVELHQGNGFTRKPPGRSLTMVRNKNYRSVVDEFQSNVVVPSYSNVPSRPQRTLSRRESVRIVLRNGSLRAARYASLMVVPSNRETTDYKIEDWIVNYTCVPPPLFMIIISLVEIAVFIYYVIDQNEASVSTTLASGVPAYSPLIYQPTRRYEAWRYLTYMFIHNGYVHLLSNLIFQLLIGLPLEMVHDFWRVGPLYLFGVLAGSLATSVVDPWVLLCGASGGCYSLIGAQFATITMNWKEMKAGWLGSPLKFLLSGPFQLAFWLVLALINTSVSIYSRFFDARTAFAAHIAGLISGYLVGLCVLKNFDEKSWKWKLQIGAIIAFALLIVFAVIFNSVYETYYPPTDDRPCCPAPISVGNVGRVQLPQLTSEAPEFQPTS